MILVRELLGLIIFESSCFLSCTSLLTGWSGTLFELGCIKNRPDGELRKDEYLFSLIFALEPLTMLLFFNLILLRDILFCANSCYYLGVFASIRLLELAISLRSSLYFGSFPLPISLVCVLFYTSRLISSMSRYFPDYCWFLKDEKLRSLEALTEPPPCLLFPS